MYLMETIDKRLLIDLILFCCIPLLGEISCYLVNSEIGLAVQQPADMPLAEGLHMDVDMETVVASKQRPRSKATWTV